MFKGAGQPWLPRGPKAAPAREKLGAVWTKENRTVSSQLSPSLLLSSIKGPNGGDSEGARLGGHQSQMMNFPRSFFFSSGIELHPDAATKLLLTSAGGLFPHNPLDHIHVSVSQSSVRQRRASKCDTEEESGRLGLSSIS